VSTTQIKKNKYYIIMSLRDKLKRVVDGAKNAALSTVVAGATMLPAGNALAQKSQVKDLNTQPTTTMVDKVSNAVKDPQDASQLNQLNEAQRKVYDSDTYAELQALNLDEAEDGAQLNKLTDKQLALYNSRVYQELQAMNLPPVEAEDGASLNRYTAEQRSNYDSSINNSLGQDSVAKKNPATKKK
jgi:hypothetical protein